MVGVIGFFVDAACRPISVRNSRLVAGPRTAARLRLRHDRQFLLNRAITFRHSKAPSLRAFLRYCGVASLGLVVDYAVYQACVLLAPRVGLPRDASHAAGLRGGRESAASMVVTFVGFRSFAFRS